MADRNRTRINNFLGGFGLATLDNPHGMVQQLGFLVRDHDHFRQMLIKCEPEQRHAMYESLRPHLRFEAKPLDVYILEGKQDAERRQLPVMDADGKLHPYRPPEVNSEEVNDAVAEAMAKWHLELVCKKCTKAATFSGMRKADAVQEARNAGWVYYEVEGKSREICPDCPGTRTPVEKIGTREEFDLVTEFKMVPLRILTRYLNPEPGWTQAEFDKNALEAARRWSDDGKPGSDTPPKVN